MMLSLTLPQSVPRCPRPFNLAGHVLAHAATAPDKIALQVLTHRGAKSHSYGQLAAAVRGAATGFLALGLGPGDRVLLRLGNCVEFPVAFLGAITAGLVPVPTSTQLSRPELERIAAETRPRLIVAGPDIARPEGVTCRTITRAELAAFASLPPAAFAMGDPDRPAYVIYTSGTGGQPRAVVHAHRAIWARRMMWADWYGLGEADRVLHAGAFNWTYTLGTGLMDPWAAGATALIPAPDIAAEELPLLLKDHDVTIFAAAPGVYRKMLIHLPGVGLPHLRHGLSAGEKLPATTAEAWADATGTLIYEALGMSECSTFVSAAPDRPGPAGSIGYPQRGRRIAVLGADGKPVARGTPGVLAVHKDDPGLFLGYLDQPGETAARYRGEWFVTGDMVTMAADGAITYLGRDDDMMNAGGYRVSPLEVEAALACLPATGDCAAVELPVKADASVIALFYTGTADPAALQAQAEAELARYKQPRLYLHRDALPTAANGKVNRRQLREEWKAGQ